MRQADVLMIVHRAIDQNPTIVRMDLDIASLKSDVAILRSDVNDLKTDAQAKGVLLEAMQVDLRRVLEVVLDWGRRFGRQEDVPDSLQRLSDRQDAVESSLTRHIKNRKVRRSVEP